MRKLPRLVIALGLVSLFTDVSSEMILPLLPSLLIGGMGAGPVAVGLLEGIADAVAAVLKLVFGGLSDRAAKRKPFVLAGYTLSTAVRPLVTFATAPWHAVLVRAVDRVGKGLRSAPRDALIADAVPPDDAPKAYAFHRMMDHTGAFFGPLVASGLLFAGLSAREAIALAWIPGAVAVLTLFFFAKEKPRKAAAAAAGEKRPRVKLPASLWALLSVVGLFSVGVAGDSFLLVRGRDLGLAEPLLPALWSVLHLAKVIAASQMGRYNVHSRFAVVAAWAAVAAGFALLTVQSPAIIWVGAVVVGVGHGAREPVEKVLVRNAAPDEARGRAFGAYYLFTGLASLPSGLLIGEVWEQVSGRAALTVSAAVVAVAAVALALLRRR